jgi:hypothetical protein
VTEVIPTAKLEQSITAKFGDSGIAIRASEDNNVVNAINHFRSTLSPIGSKKSRPVAYPSWVAVEIQATAAELMLSETAIAFRIG